MATDNMDPDVLRQKIKLCWLIILDKLSNPLNITDYLYMKDCLSEHDCDLVKAEKINLNSVRELMRILARKGDKAVLEFMEALKLNEEDHIYDAIMAADVDEPCISPPAVTRTDSMAIELTDPKTMAGFLDWCVPLSLQSSPGGSIRLDDATISHFQDLCNSNKLPLVITKDVIIAAVKRRFPEADVDDATLLQNVSWLEDKHVSKIPARGVPEGPASGLADLCIGPKVKAGTSTRSSCSGVRSSTKCELVWRSQAYARYSDVTFFGVDHIVYITYDIDTDGYTKDYTLRVMDHKGETSQLPFPVFLTKPKSVCESHDSNQLAIIDVVKVDERHININTNTILGWRNTDIITSHKVHRVALLPTGGCVCTVDNGDKADSVVLFDANGQEVWVTQLTLPADGASEYFVILSTTPSGYIIISDPNTDKVTVMNASGDQLHQFPSLYLREPLGICADSQGDVLVYDKALKALSLFSKNGQYVRKINDCDRGMGGMSLYQDRYLICMNVEDGLSLYKL